MSYQYKASISLRGKVAIAIGVLTMSGVAMCLDSRIRDRYEATRLYTQALQKADLNGDDVLSPHEKVGLYRGMGFTGLIDLTNDPIGQAYLTEFHSLQGEEVDIDFVRKVISGTKRYLNEK